MSLLVKLLTKVKNGLQKTKKLVLSPIYKLLQLHSLSEDQVEELESILLQADLGMLVVDRLIKKIRSVLHNVNKMDVKSILKNELLDIIKQVPVSDFNTRETQVLLVIGINGVGKTTTIGKLAAYLKSKNESVLLVAGDTFRAAAIEQLEHWGQLAKVPVISTHMGGSSAAVVYDGIAHALSEKISWVLVDTAGRLHTKDNLVRELQKIRRSIQKNIASAPQRVILVLDATIGQNGLIQAKIFKESIGVTDIILTKLDGTAKGGIVVSIIDQLKIPIAFIGVGENLDDLLPFNPEVFVDGLLNGDE